MKKLICFTIATLLVIFVVAGCAEPEPAPTPEPSPAPTPSPEPAPAPTPSPKPTPTPEPAPTPAGEQPKYGGTLREVSVAVPALVGWPPDLVGASSDTPQILFDSFLRGDNKGNYIPWLAESYDLANDQMSITFKLREDVYFHDGSHLDAEIAKWNLETEMATGRLPYWESVEVLDDYTLRVNFNEWRNTLMGGFADGATTWMVSKQAYDKYGEEWMRENAVGTGPFKFVSFARDTSLVAVKNENWWQKDLPYLDKYEVLYIADPTTQQAVLKAGEADFIGIEPGKQAADYANMGMDIYADIVSIFALVPDTANPESIWANKQFREAVEYAIDREAIAESLGYGYLEAPYQLPPRSNVHYDPNFVGRRYDPDKAKQLLAEAGIPDGTKAKIIVSPLSPSRDAVLTVQAYLAAIGIDVELDFPQWSKYVTHLRGTWENAALFQVFPALGGTNYNATFAFYFNPPSGMLQSWEKTDEFVALLDASATSPSENPALIRAVLDYIYEDALIIPIHEAGRAYAVQPYVKNGDWLTRSMSAWKKGEQIWLDK